MKSPIFLECDAVQSCRIFADVSEDCAETLFGSTIKTIRKTYATKRSIGCLVCFSTLMMEAVCFFATTRNMVLLILLLEREVLEVNQKKFDCVICAAYSLNAFSYLPLGPAIKHVLIQMKTRRLMLAIGSQKYRGNVKRINGLRVSVRNSTNFIILQTLNQRHCKLRCHFAPRYVIPVSVRGRGHKC